MAPRPKAQKSKTRTSRIQRWTPRVRSPKIKPRKPDIIVGIPTLNEADNIGHLIKVVDEGLCRYFPDKKALIVDADSNSSDGTKKIFLNTKTKTPKYYLKTPPGKGAGLKSLFEYFLSKESAEVLITLDGDVTSVTPRWVRNLVTPILKGFDHNFPIYNRHEFDGSITNHLAYPVVRGVLGIDVRQPMAGEVGLSRKAVDRIYNRPWPMGADKYGADIFMASSSIFGELKIAETYLGMKAHKPSQPKLDKMFEEVAASMFEMLDESRQFWGGTLRTRKPPIFFKDSRTTKFPEVNVDYRGIRKMAREKFAKHKTDIKKIVGKPAFEKLEKSFRKNANLYISTEDWMKVVYAFVCGAGLSPIKRARALRPLYYARFLSFYKDCLDVDHKLAEQGIIEQADLFFKMRDKLIVDTEKY